MTIHSLLPATLSSGPAEDTLVVLLGELANARPDVYEHGQRVSELAGEVARALPALDVPWWEVERAALAHDIGKLAVPAAVLYKPAALTSAERRLMESHAIIGSELLQTLPFSDDLTRLARAHHERIDGTGYPDGLRGRDIPLGAQIIAVCDSWDAMTWTRPYRAAMSFDEAAAELRAHAGTQWRHEVVRLMLDVVSSRAATRAARRH